MLVLQSFELENEYKKKSEKRRWKYSCVGVDGGALKCKTSWMTQISPSPCHSMCVHFVNTQIIEKHFCVDAAVWNIPCSVEIVKLHRKILIKTANIYFNIDTCTMVHVECMLRQAGKLFSCSCTPSCNNLNKQTHKKLQQLIAIDYDSKSAYF